MKLYKIIISLVVTIVLALLVSGQFEIYNIIKDRNVGSVSNDGVYLSKHLTVTNASTTAAIPVRGGPSVLGSVVVLKTSAVALGIYDGTSTTTGATLIGTLPASIAAGTYTFDVATNLGIVLGSNVGFDGNYVITYR